MTASAELRMRVAPGGRLGGRLRVPGDKSVSHRAVILGAVAEGVTTAAGLLEGEDVLATVAAMRALGVSIEGPRDGHVRVQGVGLQGLAAPAGALDLGNSGTAMRLLAGLLAGQSFATTLVGDASLSRRPMMRVVEPLRRMGAQLHATPDGTPPLRVEPVPQLRGIRYRLPVASAQVKSALLLAGLYAQGTTCVLEPGPSRDHTERMLAAFGCETTHASAGVCIEGGQRPQGTHVDVPGDLSSAAFFLVGACIAPGSSLELEGVGVNPTRIGVIDILRAMGGDIELRHERRQGGEPVADIRVRSASLHGVRIGAEQVALAIDEFPALAVAAACSEGETVVSGAAELRVKESDRIAAVVSGLRALGVEAEERADGMRIRGGAIAGGTVDSRGDHRLAMAFAMAALRARAEIVVRDCRNVATSFPGFVPLARTTGLRVTEQVSA